MSDTICAEADLDGPPFELGAIEIEITPPGATATTPWWTVRWDGTRASVQTAPGLQGDTPDEWGIPYLRPDYIDTWRAEGGTAYVIEQLLDGFAGHGATARITAVHGNPRARSQILETLRTFVDEHPGCVAELRRFTDETPS